MTSPGDRAKIRHLSSMTSLELVSEDRMERWPPTIGIYWIPTRCPARRRSTSGTGLDGDCCQRDGIARKVFESTHGIHAAIRPVAAPSFTRNGSGASGGLTRNWQYRLA